MTVQSPFVREARIFRTESGVIRSEDYDDIYHSQGDPLAEKSHVFCNQHQFPERWIDCATKGRSSFSILETGFGLGLNFLTLADLWVKNRPRDLTLHYISIEKHPIEKSTLADILRRHSLNKQLVTELMRGYPAPIAGIHRCYFPDNLCLTLVYEDAGQALEQMAPGIDACFLDGFSPERNPAMWSRSVTRELGRILRSSATLSSYSVAGSLKRDLTRAGFNVTKRPGFGSKREMLWATRHDHDTSATAQVESVAVIGAGLAGFSVVHALARRGHKVTVFEAEAAPLLGASGMYQLAYYPQLALNPNAFHRFSLQAFSYLLTYLADDCFKGRLSGECCGMFRPIKEIQHQEAAQRLAELYGDTILRYVDAKEASHLQGVPTSSPGLYFPRAGWVDPVSLTRIQQQFIEADTRFSCRIRHIQRGPGGWRLYSCDGDYGDYSQVIITAGYGSVSLPTVAHLPLEPVRGQTAILRTNEHLAEISSVIAATLGFFPAHEGYHGLSATYGHGDDDRATRPEDHEFLATEFARQFPGFDHQMLPGPVGVRAVARDRCPIVGPISDPSSVMTHYAALQRNAHAQVPRMTPDPPGLYICAGFGSHGMTHIPLSAEYLASLICGEPLPLTGESIDQLDPNRFLIRDLKQQKVTS